MRRLLLAVAVGVVGASLSLLVTWRRRVQRPLHDYDAAPRWLNEHAYERTPTAAAEAERDRARIAKALMDAEDR
jgi:hypothetical protein